MDLGDHFKNFLDRNIEEYTLQEYLEICRNDPTAYCHASERLPYAIGKPELIDTKNDPVLAKIFPNKILKRYKVFE